MERIKKTVTKMMIGKEDRPAAALGRLRSVTRSVSIAPSQTSLEVVASPETVRPFVSEITVRSLSAQKIIVTGKLSGRPLDLIASLQQDGSLQVKGYSGTLPTDLTTRSANANKDVTIGGRRDGCRVDAQVSIQPEGGVAVRELGGTGTQAAVAVPSPSVFDHVLNRIPKEMAELFQATLMYLLAKKPC